MHFLKTRLLQERDRFRAAPAHLAMNNNLALESSSLTRLGKSFSGIRCPPMLQI